MLCSNSVFSRLFNFCYFKKKKKRKQDKIICGLLGSGPRMDLLLERLSQIEALLHVVVVGSGSVDVPNAAVASLHFTMLLQSLKESVQGFSCCFKFCVRFLLWAVLSSR